MLVVARICSFVFVLFVGRPAVFFGEAQQGEGVGGDRGVGVGFPLFVTKKCVGGAPVVPRGALWCDAAWTGAALRHSSTSKPPQRRVPLDTG